MKTEGLFHCVLSIVLLASCNAGQLPPKVTRSKGLIIDKKEFSIPAKGGSARACFTGYDRWIIAGCTEYLFIDNNWKNIGSTYDEWMGITLSNRDLLTGSWYTAYKPKDEDGQYSVNELHIMVNQNDTGEQRRVEIFLAAAPLGDIINVIQEAD